MSQGSQTKPHITLLLDPSVHRPLAYPITQIHINCIATSHTVATFLPPLDFGKMLDWWLDVFAQAETTSTRHKPETYIVATLVPKPGKEISPTDLRGAERELARGRGLDAFEVAGYAYLKDHTSETGPFRGEVLKLLVDPRFRRIGVARAVMNKIEEVAAEAGLTRLVLDTTPNTPAEHVYPRLGWTRLGVIPAEGISPEDGRLLDSVFFYKLLPGHPASGSIWQGQGQGKGNEKWSRGVQVREGSGDGKGSGGSSEEGWEPL